MPWVRLDDQFSEHPKVVKAGPLAMAMHVAALCYSSRNLTDGHIPRPVAKKLLDLDGIAFVWDQGESFGGGRDVEWHDVVADLIEAGLWDESEDGYEIHDYLEFQPSRAEVEEKRADLSAKRAAAGRKGAKRRWQTPEPKTPGQDSKDGKRDGKQNTTGMATRWQDDGPDPGPVPDPPIATTDLDGDNGSRGEVSSRPALPAKERNPYYDAAVAALDLPERGSHEGLIGRIAAKARGQGHDPSEITNRAALHLATFDFPLTPGSLLKRWDELGSRVTTATPSEKREVRRQLEQMRRRQRIIEGGAA